ncbi:hypothetical protein T484DRAFT_2652725 [Baffinella frigidus]|nr:hypothetical protein T484DRAFT_2652725 [Cryptophyta sp. CCMP2293]
MKTRRQFGVCTCTRILRSVEAPRPSRSDVYSAKPPPPQRKHWMDRRGRHAIPFVKFVQYLWTRRGRVTPYRGTSLIRKRPPPGPYSRAMPRALWSSRGGGRFL